MNTEDITTQIRQHEKSISQLKYQLFLAKKATTPVVDKNALRKQEKIKRYSTGNGLTIHNLRLAGNTVKVTHIRYASNDVVYPRSGQEPIVYSSRMPVTSYMRGGYPFLSNGGATHIHITRPDQTWFIVSSLCHELDSFDYKLGVKRALDQISPAEAQALLVVNQEAAPVPAVAVEQPVAVN